MRHFLQRLALIVLFLAPAPLLATEPALEFIEGLRQRRYFDTALQYLDEAEQLNLAPEVKQVLQYERAQTLLMSAKELTNLDQQRKRLDAAQAAFEDFVKASSNHPLAGRANTARGRILLEKARVDIWDGEKPSNEGSREKFRDEARKGIQEARRIFQQAADQHQKAYEAFPTFIPDEEREKKDARDEAERLYMEAQLDLSQCTYWEAQTYDRGATERKDILTKAAFEFEEIHTKYRSMVAGLYARIWQGKCFEEQDEIRIALGLYEEILGHEGTSQTMRNLKDRALRFRMICLNHEQRKDYELVVNEGEAWVRDAKARARTEVGLGIQYEMCRALESLGTDRTRPEGERSNFLNRALTMARLINRYPGELKTPSSALIQRVMVLLNREPGDPKDFNTAYGNAGVLYEEISGQNDQIRKLKAEKKLKEAQDVQKAQQATAAEMARLYDLAIKMASAQDEPRLVNIARLRLAYGYLLQGRYLDAGIVADHQMVKYSEEFPEVARESGFIAMSAYDYAYNDAPGDREFEASMVREAAEKLASRWPDSDRANDARNAVAKIYWQEGDHLEAANWWLKIPQGSTQYVESRIRAGNAYWRHYVLQVGKPEGERPSTDELVGWKKSAIEQLELGLNDAEAATPDDQPLSDDLVRAKLTLANIRNLDGQYTNQDPPGAIELLTAEPHPIVKAVEIPEGQARPTDETKAQSRPIASFAYQQLLRAYIGVKDLDKARDARVKLEQVAGSEDAAALTQVFVAFGNELKAELERLHAGGEDARLVEVREGFESFLNDLFNRQDGQTFYTLLWIAETYTSLAEGSEDNPAKMDEFFDKAAQSYRSIVSKAESDANFVSNPSQTVAAKLRLVNCLRRKRDFEGADAEMTAVLKEQPNAPDAQFEAAKLYQEWGSSGAPDAWKKLEVALYGKQQDDPKMWGWGYAAQSLQRALAMPQSNPDAKKQLEQLHFDARYHLVETERELGKTHPETSEGIRHLEKARAAIMNFLRISTRWPEPEYERFNEMYRQLLADLGDPVVDLPREPGSQKLAQGSPGENTPTVGGTDNGQPETEPVPTEPESNKLLMILVLLGGGLAVAGLFFLALKQGRASRPKYDVDLSKPREEKAPKLAGISIGEIAEPALGGVAVATPKKVRPAKAAPAAAAATASAAGPAPAKRKLTPEEAELIRRKRAAQAAKAAAAGGTAQPAAAPVKRRPAQPGEVPKKRPAAPGAEGQPRPKQRPPTGDGAPPPQKRPRPKPPTEPPAE
ncbi:MAG: hypothetical protein KDA58_03395 [Planctomycetaceae bacterium]|nr:hypothetical protein [Planctomycetaceae bacterium]